jgi:hypothetical protein
MKIIKRIIKFEGVDKVFYHKSLSLSTRKDTMNVYVEDVTANKKEALVFHDAEEAERMARFLDTTNKSQVINK